MSNLVLWAVLVACSPAEEVPYANERPGFRLLLPSSGWRTLDQGEGDTVVKIFTPDADYRTRCCVIVLPEAALEDGLATREAQIGEAAGALYERVAFEASEEAGRTVTRWEYRVGGATTIEWHFVDGGRHVLFQLAAPATTWADEEGRAMLERIRASFVWEGGDVAESRVAFDRTTPQEIRARRAQHQAAPPRALAVERHRIVARVEPEAHSLEVRDTLDVVALADLASALELYFSVVRIDGVEGPPSLTWRVDPHPSNPTESLLKLTFDPPLAKGDAAEVLVRASAADFVLETDQQLVAEIGVLGQVRPDSSWSSHVLWYPMQTPNDAAMDVTFDVPEECVAVTGGALAEDVVEDGRRRMRYVDEGRHRRILPHGFAVGAYVSKDTTSEGGLHLTVHAFPGEERRIDQRIDALLTAARVFERTLGPLPWEEVRFVHVRPLRLETGVSLPGMILVSDRYFPDLEDVDLADGDLGDAGSLGLLVVADELSHQWNIYAADLPNELGEGVSTFTNALFVEELHGAESYRKTIAYCRRGWLGGAGRETEFAIADPFVYSNTRYRSVVFCKTPVVLDHLRRHLGDERFFAGFRAAFARAGQAEDGFDRFERGFSEGSGVDLRPFFDQWFFRAGFPTVTFDHAPTDGGVRIVARQTQDEPPYALHLEFEITCDDGSTHRHLALLDRAEQPFDVPLPSKVTAVTLAHADVLPAKVEER